MPVDFHKLSVHVVAPGSNSTVVEEEFVGIVAQVGEVGISEQLVVAAFGVVEIPVVVVVRTAVLQVTLPEQEHSILGDIVQREERSCILYLLVGVDLEDFTIGENDS